MSETNREVSIKKGIRRDNALFLVILTILGILALIVYWFDISQIAFYAIIVAIVAFASIGILRNLMVFFWAKNWSKYVRDERMKRINAYAGYQAWGLTSLVVVVIMLLALFNIIDLGTYPSLIIVYFVMMYGWIAFKWYYGRKGDVE